MLERLTRVTVPLSESEFSMLRGLAMKELRPTKEQARFLLRQALGLTEDGKENPSQHNIIPQTKPEDQAMETEFLDFINKLKAAKPNDRSERDRYWAITITELEKAFAIFKTFVVDRDK